MCPLKNNIIKYKQGGYTNPPLLQIIQWFKTMTTTEYIQIHRKKFIEMGR